MRRGQKPGLSYFTVGLLTLSVIVIGTYFGFTKAIPFQHHYTIKGVFKSANNVKPNSPVRIAGVTIGKVSKVDRIHAGEESAIVSMRIDDKGLPIHKDATMEVRPRIFLEGNFFVDLKPGSPSQPTLGDGDTVPVNQTSAPVQIDQILTSLQSDTRKDLQTLLDEFSRGWDGAGGKGFNRSIPYWESAYKNSAIVNDATRGILEHDLSGYIKNAGVVAEALDRNDEALKSLITDFHITARAFAREDVSLTRAIAELPRLLRAGQPALRELNDSFPALRRFIVDFRPGVRSSGPALDASLPFIREARGLVSNSELRGLTRDLRPTVPSLAKLNSATVALYEQVRPASSCQNEVILPWTKDKIADPAFPAPGKVYEEAPKPLVGLAGESRTGDANGQWFRVLLGTANYATPTGNPGEFFASTSPLMGVNPPKPSARSPMRPDVPCETQQAPDLRTNPTPISNSRQVRIAPSNQDTYDKWVAKSVRYLRKDAKRLGLKYKITTKPVTRSQIEAAAKAAGR